MRGAACVLAVQCATVLPPPPPLTPRPAHRSSSERKSGNGGAGAVLVGVGGASSSAAGAETNEARNKFGNAKALGSRDFQAQADRETDYEKQVGAGVGRGVGRAQVGDGPGQASSNLDTRRCTPGYL